MRTRVALVVLTALLVVAGAALPAQAGPARHHFYLSLGDSLAFGYQPDLVAAGDLDPAHYRGYAEDLASIDPRLDLVNFGCPGETTTTFVNGGCPWPAPLHDSYGGAASQLAAAQAFLAAHPGQVSLISVDVGSNDLLAVVSACKAEPPADQLACIQRGFSAALPTVVAGYSRIVGSLRALAPTARIVVFNLYNPLAFSLPGSDQLVAVFNQALATVAAGVHGRLADAFRAVNGSAGSPAERARICVLTWECTSFANIHPTTLGYLTLAAALLRAEPSV
jgi:lysophospholipase L1-like esterase